MFTEHLAVVAAVYDPGIFNLATVFKNPDNVTDPLIDERDHSEVMANALPDKRFVHHLASVLNLELEARFVPKLNRVERRSLAYHRAVADSLQENPEEIIQRARTHLERLRTLHPHAAALTNRWRAWLDLPPDILIKQFTDTSELAQNMRQVSPFAGVLSAEQRKTILARLRRHEAA